MNPTIAPPTLSPRTKIAATLALAALAVLGNLLNVPLFFGVTFIFGSVAVMLAIALLGTLPGLLVGIAGGLYTLALFGHPYALLIFSAEALAVGLLYRKGVKNLVLADLAYWLVIGAPLVLLLYRGALGMGWTPATLIAFKQPLNGLFNALIAGLILLGLQLFWRGAKHLALATPRLADLLFHVLLTAVLLAGIVPTVHEGQSQLSQSESFLANEMERTARQLARSFEANPQADPTLQLALLAEAHTVSGMNLALLANDGRALASRGKLESMAKPGSTQALAKGLEIWLPAGDMPIMKRWKQGHYQYRMPVPGMAAEILVAQPAAPLVGKLEQGHLTLFGFLTALLLLGIATSLALSRWLTGPLSALEAAGGRLTAQIADGIRPDFPHSPVREYDHLGDTLRDMTAQLADSFHELHRIQDNLEDQVRSRTSELRHSEERLKRERDFNAALFSAAGALMLVLDRNGNIVRLNEAGEQLTGYRLDEIINKPFWEFFLLPEERDGVISVFKNLKAGTIIPRYENHWRMRDGSKRLFDWSNAAITNEGGEVEYIVTIGVDITERHAAEAALADEAQRSQAILNNAVDGIITINEKGIVSSMNKAAIHIFGYAPNEVIGQNIKMLMPEPYHSAHDGYLHNYMTSGKAKIIGIGREVTGQRMNGEQFPMDLSVSEISHQGQRMFVGLVRDVTERKHTEKMKNEFVSTVSHELRTPLTSISGSLALATSGALGELPEQAKAMLDIAHKNSKHLSSLINDLLDMEKMIAGKMAFNLEHQRLHPLLERAIEANQAYGDQHGVRYVLAEPAGNIQVNVDGQRLMQVLSNFLSNAAKFSPQGSSVEVMATRSDGHVRVSVVDHGPGIPAEFRGRIFQKFNQADSSDTRQKGGTGLGLAISKELIEHMGGSIGYESEPGQGATFFFELPIQS